jgi:hypothetical protein
MWFDYVNSAGIVGALGLTAFQTRRLLLDARDRDEDRRTERALDLYRDLVVDGDTAKAIESVSVMLRNAGGEKFGCVTWLVIGDEEFGPGGLLCPGTDEKDRIYQDFYRVLWYFERVENSLHFGLIQPEVLFRSIGFHCWWWGQLLRNIHSVKAVSALHVLAPRATEWARRNGEYDRWLTRCATDFDAGPPVPLSGGA